MVATQAEIAKPIDAALKFYKKQTKK